MKSLSQLGLDYYLTQSSSEEPSVEPIATSDVQQQTYASTDDLTMIASYIKAARKLIESRIPGGRALVNQTLNLYLSRFPYSDAPLLLPNPPLQSVTKIGYYDAAGSTQTLASTSYSVYAPTSAQGYVVPLIDTQWPAAQERPDAVVIQYVAGYGSTGSRVPETLRLAVKMLAAHWYAQREAVLVGTISKPIELGVDALLAAEGWGFYG